MAAVTICSDFRAQENKVSSSVSPSICHEVMWPDAMMLVFWMLSFKPVFSTLLFHFHQESLQFLFDFCHKGGIIWISEVIDISPVNPDSSLCFIQPAFHMMYSAYKLNKQGDNIQPWLLLSQFGNSLWEGLLEEGTSELVTERGLELVIKQGLCLGYHALSHHSLCSPVYSFIYSLLSI